MKRHFLHQIYLFVAALLSATTLFAHEALFFGPEQLSSSLITAITQTPDGLLWVGTENGLNRFDGYRFVHTAIHGPGPVRPTEVSTLCCGTDGRLWVGTARGLWMHDRATDRFLPVAFPDSLEPRISLLQPLAQGQMTAGTAGYGTFLVDAATLQAQPQTGLIPDGEQAFVAAQKVLPRLLALQPEGEVFTCSVTDKAGNIYIGTRGSGLYLLPAGSARLQRMAVSADGLDLNRARVQDLFIDRSGNLWVGCQQKGLLMVPLHRRPLFQTWSFSAQHQQTGTCISAIAPAQQNSHTAPEGGGRVRGGEGPVHLWVAVQGDGIYGFSALGHICAHPAAPAGVETLFRSSDGHYWLGTTDGLWAYDPATGRATLRMSLPGTQVNTICELPGGHLAVSCFGAGLCIFDPKEGRVLRQLTMHDTDTLGRGRLANDWIFSLDTDRQGRLWMGTSSGVCCYDPARHSFRTCGWDLLMDHEQCTAVRVLRSGDVLLACERGLYRWSRAHGLQPEDGTDPLQGKTVSYITEDRQGDIWLSTNEGIWQWSPQQQLVAYVGAYGLRQREFVQGAGYQDAEGNICFGTADGLTRFHPDSLRRHEPAAAALHLTAFVIQGTPANTLTRSNGRRVMEQAVGDCHDFSLSYVDATFRMEFSLLDFAGAEGVSYAYRMGHERRWQQTQEGENDIAFSHLAPGTYQLEVKALRDGIYTPSQTYRITVRPPWWNSTGAHIIYFLLLLAAAAAAAVAYQRHLRNQMDREKLHFLMSAINTQDTPLSLDDMKRAINSFVQSRRQQHNLYANASNVLDQMETPEVRGNDEALMDRIIQSVNHHLDDSEFSVEQLCEEVGISRAHLHRKMKELTGMPVTEFIRNIRLEQAARLLKEHKLNVTQVAYSVGFSNLGYFSTVFRKHFGVNPKDYGQQRQEDQPQQGEQQQD